jgi:hypothetical protein
MGVDRDLEFGPSSHRPVRHPAAQGTATQSTAQQPPSSEAGRVLRLQQLAGNRATSHALVRSPLAARRAPTPVQRQTGSTAVDDPASQARLAQDQAAAASRQAALAEKQSRDALTQANAAMSEAKLASLRAVAVGKISLAYTAYVSACRDVRDSIRAAAKQNAEMMALVLDIAMGFATPGLAKWVVGFANRIPVEASTTAYRVAMAALDGDRAKAVLGGMTKVANQSLKANAMVLAGETDVDAFVGGLETQTQMAFDLIIESLPSRSAAEVGIITAAFHSSITNHDNYRREIKGLCDLYERDVSPIGELPMMVGSGYGTAQFAPEAAWVRDGSSRKLAIVTYQPGLLGIWGNKYFLNSWVDPQMQKLAIAKQTGRYGRVDEIDVSELRVIKP